MSDWSESPTSTAVIDTGVGGDSNVFRVGGSPGAGVLFFDIPLSEIVLGSTVGKGTMAGGEEREGTEGEEVEGGAGGEDIDPTIRREPTGPVEDSRWKLDGWGWREQKWFWEAESVLRYFESFCITIKYLL